MTELQKQPGARAMIVIGQVAAQTQIPSRSKRAAKKRSNLLDQFQDFFGSIL
jgi:hypothetical protein